MNQAHWTSVLALPVLALSLVASGCAMDASDETPSPDSNNKDSVEGNSRDVDTGASGGTTNRTTYAWEALGTVTCTPDCTARTCFCSEPVCPGRPVLNAPCTPTGRICQVKSASGQEATRWFCH